MLATPPLPIPNPQLAQQPVEELLLHFTTALSSWLSDSYGLVQTGVDKTGRHRYPQLYRQDGSPDSVFIYPDDQMKALSFFEFDGPSTIEWADGLHLAGDWTHQLAAVVWLNLPLIDPRGYDFSSELALDFLTRGLLASPLGSKLEPGAIEQRAALIFQRYNFPQERQQLLMYPYAGFRIPFTVRERYVACALPFTPAPKPPMSTITPVAPTGAPVTTSRTYAFTAKQEFTIVHNLGRRVIVTIYDSDNDVIDADICYTDLNTLTITFSQPLTGTVVLL